MVFSSIPFLFLFLPLCLLIYYAVPYSLKNGILLLFSLIFYAWGEPVYIVLMLFASAVDLARRRRVAGCFWSVPSRSICRCWRFLNTPIS